MYYTHEGNRYHFTDEGEGRTLVFLHGLGGNLHNWTYQRQHFSSSRRVICIDLPGHGKSEGKLIPFGDFARIVFEVLSHLGVSRFDVCGLAKGARVGIQLAADYPDHVDSLVIVNTCLSLCPSDKAERIELYDRLLLGHEGAVSWATQLLEQMAIPAGCRIHRGFMRSLEAMDGAHVRARFAEVLEYDQSDVSGRIKAATLLVRGAKDRLVRDRCHAELLALIPGAQEVVLDECGHLPYLEKPADFNAAVESFLG